MTPRPIPAVRHLDQAIEHWRRAADIRREWLHCGLSTRPADRSAAEQSLAMIYARIGRARPRFVWVDSPYQALPLIGELPVLDDLYRWVLAPPRDGCRPPLASDLVASASQLRSELDAGLLTPEFDPPPPKRRKGAGEPERERPPVPPLDALAAGVGFRRVVRRSVRDALYASLSAIFLPVRTALTGGRPVAVCWYGQQEAHWIGYYDVWRRLGLARYGPAAERHLDAWATLARSAGWWWPGERVCVVVERPSVLRVRPVPGGWCEEVRLCRGGSAAVEYRDGWRPALG